MYKYLSLSPSLPPLSLSLSLSPSLPLSLLPLDPLGRRRVRSATRCLLRAAPSCARARANVACDTSSGAVFFTFITLDVHFSHIVRIAYIFRLPTDISASPTYRFSRLKSKTCFNRDQFLSRTRRDFWLTLAVSVFPYNPDLHLDYYLNVSFRYRKQ